MFANISIDLLKKTHFEIKFVYFPICRFNILLKSLLNYLCWLKVTLSLFFEL
ncbi:hypothetical protein Ataiwa_05750 [Algoriphagus taiwanensis]|uniref:Uncharacterized protein n=1 Tax=Algoriphagus taiwanensis TaxID=1445656 RepID=A0ABQ6PYM7_9BACT|nr:hypothetical protein Ataiwa_05750 [Algoriphagus taiwanensis]